MKIYIVNRNTLAEAESDNIVTLEKAFDSLEKAEAYKIILHNKVSLIFHCFSYFSVDELEVY